MTKKSTAFSAAFDKAGFDRLRFELKAVAPRFSREDWIAIHDEAMQGMGKNGHPLSVQQDQTTSADLSRPTPSEGQNVGIQQDQAAFAGARSQMLNADQCSLVQQGQIDCVSVEHPMPEGQARSVQQDHKRRADGQPIAGESHLDLVQQGQHPNASFRDTIPSEGRLTIAAEAVDDVPSAGEPIASAEDQSQLAKQSHFPRVPAAREPISPRRPSPAQRTAALRAGHSSVPSIFDRIKLADNTPVGEIYSDQLPRRIAHDIREASFLLRLKNYAIPPEPMKIRDYIPAEFVENARKESEHIDVKSYIGEGILLEPDGKLSFIRRSA